MFSAACPCVGVVREEFRVEFGLSFAREKSLGQTGRPASASRLATSVTEGAMPTKLSRDRQEEGCSGRDVASVSRPPMSRFNVDWIGFDGRGGRGGGGD